jgi:uncharacterized protein YbaP (TraB family)
MKKFFVALFILFVISGKSQDQSSLLWEISGNGLPQSSYLFGTIHIIPKKAYFFTPLMHERFKSCKTLALEIDISDLSLRDKINLSSQAFLTDGQTLQMLMGDSAYYTFKTYLTDSLGMSETKIDKRYNKMQPFFVNSLLLKDYLGKVKFYEKELAKYARKNNLSMYGLETIDFQMSLIKKIPLEEQIDYFLDVQSMTLFDSLLAIYKSQDLDKLYEFSMQMDDNTPGDSLFFNDFIYHRNHDWIPKIEEMIKEQPVFIAVGALHLPGKKGVIELLRQKGYIVKPVISSDKF